MCSLDNYVSPFEMKLLVCQFTDLVMRTETNFETMNELLLKLATKDCMTSIDLDSDVILQR